MHFVVGFTVACATAITAGAARADGDQAASLALGPAVGGGWTPGGLQLDARYQLALDARDWLEAGGTLVLGGGAAACAYNGLSYSCDHGAFDGDALGFAISVRHDFGRLGAVEPFVRGGVGMRWIRFPGDTVVTMTDSAKPAVPTLGLNGVAILARAGAGVRWPLSPTVALTAAVDLDFGGAGFAGTADAQRQAAISVTTGVEFRTSGARGPDRHGRPLSLAGVAAVYAPFITWEYYAWYNGAHHEPLYFDTAWHDESLSYKAYAGGADKLGHMWSHYALTRGTTEILVAGGWNKWTASLLCFGIDQLEATFSEMKDGPVWGFEIGDSIANLSGAVLAVAMENVPTLDRLFDFRLAWWPSSAYLKLAKAHPFARGDGLDISQDYTGQSYLLAIHLGELPYDHDIQWLRWMEFTDVVAGFEARHYEPAETPPQPKIQRVYGGLALNMQAVLSALLRPSRGRTIGRGISEVYSLPITTLRLFGESRTWNSGGNTTAL